MDIGVFFRFCMEAYYDVADTRNNDDYDVTDEIFHLKDCVS